MTVREKYDFWLESEYFDEETKDELIEIKGNNLEIEDRFYKDLEFGTAGLRGIIGAGTNRINIYTVRKASVGVAKYVIRHVSNGTQRGIVIAYDSRWKSALFALEAAKVFAAMGIRSYLFKELRPTPELSFAVRNLKAAAGIVITASHNPSQYNGYKVYGEDGSQLTPSESLIVMNYVNSINDITCIKVADERDAFKEDLIRELSTEMDDLYINKIKSLTLNPEITKQLANNFKLIYTPLHGTGITLINRVLKEVGFESVIVVKEQATIDPDFTTVKSPNPEERAAFELAIKQANKDEVDLIIATDPDCDRVGIAIRDVKGEYLCLTGNQIGCLLLEYILSQLELKLRLPVNAFVVKTIVTTCMAEVIAKNYNVLILDVLTGFKFIAEKIRQLDDNGDKKFIFGFEESHGYLAGTFARDKDAVVTTMLIAEMAVYYSSKGMTLYDALLELFEKYGYYMEDIESFYLDGASGSSKIKEVMDYLRQNKPNKFGKYEVKAVRDYYEGIRYVLENKQEEAIQLPKSDVLYFETTNGGWLCIRPSGTEPKIKIYFGINSLNCEQAKNRLKELKKDVINYIAPLLSQNE